MVFLRVSGSLLMDVYLISNKMKQELIWLIQRIPYGMVASYGELAKQLDIRYGIHTSWWIVGRVLSSMPENEWKTWSFFPRWRVINKQGFISTLKLWEKWIEQIKLLQAEWIIVTDAVVNMRVYEYNFYG